MGFNGYKRSLTFTITKYNNGVIASGYPKTYEGRNAFVVQNPTYTGISWTIKQLALAVDEAYEMRFTAFKRYIETQENMSFNNVGVTYDTSTPDTQTNSRYDSFCFH